MISLCSVTEVADVCLPGGEGIKKEMKDIDVTEVKKEKKLEEVESEEEGKKEKEDVLVVDARG